MEAVLNADIDRIGKAFSKEAKVEHKKLIKLKHQPSDVRQAITPTTVKPEVAKRMAQDLLAREKVYAAEMYQKRRAAAGVAATGQDDDASSVSSYSSKSGSSVSSSSSGENSGRGAVGGGGGGTNDEVEIDWGIRRWRQAGQKLPSEKHATTLYWSVYVGSWVHPHVERIQMILENKGIPYTAIDLGECEGMRVRRAKMEAGSGSSELPQLFLEGKFLGGGVEALQQLMYLIDSGILGKDRKDAAHVIPKDLPRVKRMAMMHEQKCAHVSS